ncbi:MAG: hypothetical protein QGG36_28900 [Pirellulaceae bacterium]|nr:hypothetical protein [Pirellulaceae bacterium]
MAFKFKEANSVVLGTFNIYIFRPDWISEHIPQLPLTESISLKTDLSAPGRRFTFDDSLTCTIRPDRVVFESTSPSVDCGAFIFSVIDALPHTPFQAVGNNVHYFADNDEDVNELAQAGGGVFVSSDRSTTKQRTWHVQVAEGAAVFNFQLAIRDDDGDSLAKLSVNAHLETSDCDCAKEFAQSFHDHQRRMKQLIREITTFEVE